MNVLSKSVLATSAAALLFSLSVAAPAQAGGKKHLHIHPHHHHFHGHHHGWGSRVYIGGGYDHGCGYYKRMWWKTGSFYWKAKYYDCVY